MLVHRIAYLIRVWREHPRGILVLTYNRHAAAEIRERLRRLICDAQGRTRARFSRAFTPPEGTTFLRGEVAAVLMWRKEDGSEDHHHLRSDEWEIALPELVFEIGA